MNYRPLGRTGWNVSEISFGAWAIGGRGATVDDDESLAALHRAIDLGVNFIDTADVYGDGRSERLVRPGACATARASASTSRRRPAAASTRTLSAATTART